MSFLLEGGSLPSSEAEMRGAVEGPKGSPRARRRSSRGSEGVRMGRVLGFFESLSFFQIGNEVVGLRGLSCLICVCVFRVVLVPD